MIVWGGYFYDVDDHYLNTGGRYNPGTDSWLPTSTTNAPGGCELHTAVWTGGEMIIWGDGTCTTMIKTVEGNTVLARIAGQLLSKANHAQRVSFG
jgi:hypothetical protein